MLKDSVFWWREAESEDDDVIYHRFYDKDGFDQDGFDENGFDRDGFDVNGINRWGFDRYGDDARFPYRDSEGYDRGGFDCNGFDREGFDREGFDEDGYNRQGYDRYGDSREEVEKWEKEQKKISEYLRIKEYQEWHAYDNHYKRQDYNNIAYGYYEEDENYEDDIPLYEDYRYEDGPPEPEEEYDPFESTPLSPDGIAEIRRNAHQEQTGIVISDDDEYELPF